MGQSHDPTDIAHALRRVWHNLVTETRHTEGCAGLQHQQFWVLAKLKHGPMRMSELAERVGTGQAAVTGMVDRLEERGLVERVRDDADRRVVHVALTADGERMMREAQEAFRARFEEILQPLTQEERSELERLLVKIAPTEESER